MKITRRQLKALISEELKLNESKGELNEMLPAAAAAGIAGLGTAGGQAALAGAASAATAIYASLGTLLAGSAIWMMMGDDQKEKILALVTRENLEAAFGIYMSLKGMGTDEDTVNQLLNAEAVPKIYSDFARVLQIMGEDTDVDLEQWLRDDGMPEVANMVQNTIELALKTYRGSVSRA